MDNINTDNLIIREIKHTDLNQLFLLLSNKDVMRYSAHGPYSEKQTKIGLVSSQSIIKNIPLADLLGVYLYGSYVVGGLQKYSDIDLFVILDRASTNEEKSKLTMGLLEISGIYMQDDKPPIEMTLVEKSAVNPWQYPPEFDFQYGEWLREDFKKGNIEPWPSKKMSDLALLITQVLLASITLVGDAPKKLLCKVPYQDFISVITDELPNLVSELDNAKAIKMDVADKNSVVSCFSELEKAGEKMDICINNASIGILIPIFEEDKNNNFESTIQTNLIGVWCVTKAAVNHMRNNKIHGSIINIGSVNGDSVPATGGCAYSISKAAVIHLTKTLVGELSPHKICINCISPGWFKTPMNGPGVDQIISHIPYGDIADPTDMDGLIMCLSSNEASGYVTGSYFTIDGGISWGGKSW